MLTHLPIAQARDGLHTEAVDQLCDGVVLRVGPVLLGSRFRHDPKVSRRAAVPMPDFEAVWARYVKRRRIGMPKEYRFDGISAEIDPLWQRGIGKRFDEETVFAVPPAIEQAVGSTAMPSLRAGS